MNTGLPKAHDFDIAVVGDLNVDLVLCGDVTPAFGQTEKLVDEATLTMGSSSAIFACGAARLGMRVASIGKIGDDEFGRFMLREMSGRGLDTAGVVIDPMLKTGVGVILSRPEDRAILTYLGSLAALSYADIDFSILERSRHLHIGAYFLLNALQPDVAALFRKARAAGLTVSLDTNYDPSGKWNSHVSKALEAADIFLPNETEACAITGSSDPMAALNILAEHVPIVAVKLGPRGAAARWGREVVESAPPSIPVVDTTGAGDSFDAGFIYGYLKGWDLPAMLRFACICGALSTRAAGGTAAQATLSEALALM
ncbi:MAG TPA: sugar kinase [Aggregatilineales bacterium]|nr:sugar kinase [Aggregatilineales bacterium]